MVTLTEIAEALSLDPKRVKTDFSTYGKVISINPDNTYQVSLNGSDTTVKCARLTGAKVGDVVLVTVLQNGYAVVTGCVGGDTDAQDAQATADSTAQYFWADTDGAHVTEILKDDFISTPSGGNLLLHSNSIKIRRALITLAELTGSGMTVYDSNGVQRAQFGAWSTLGDPTSNNVQIGDNTIQWRNGSTYKASIKYDPTVPCLHFRDTPVKMDAMLNGVFTVTAETLFNSAVITGNSHASSTATFTNTKYYPIGIVGFNSPDTSYFVPARIRLSAQSSGTATVSYDIRNVSSSDRTGSYKVDILWLKVTI